MTRFATGEFVVKLLPLGVEGQDRIQDSKFGRMLIDKTISGGLVATTVGQMLTAMTDVKGSAGYVAIEKVDGVLDGKKGLRFAAHGHDEPRRVQLVGHGGSRLRHGRAGRPGGLVQNHHRGRQAQLRIQVHAALISQRRLTPQRRPLRRENVA